VNPIGCQFRIPKPAVPLRPVIEIVGTCGVGSDASPCILT
jgi:hypothetical protein